MSFLKVFSTVFLVLAMLMVVLLLGTILKHWLIQFGGFAVMFGMCVYIAAVVAGVNEALKRFG